jgi:signal recognition particle receptor subunit beta
MGASGAIIVGDLTREDPWTAMWSAADMFEEALPGRPLCLALNKRDMAEPDSAETVQRMARRYDSEVFETSALTGDCVTPMFRALARTIRSRGL